MVAAPQRHVRCMVQVEGQGRVLGVTAQLVWGGLQLALELLMRALGGERTRETDRGARLRATQLLSMRGNGDKQLLRLHAALLLRVQSLQPSRQTCVPRCLPRSTRFDGTATLLSSAPRAPILPHSLLPATCASCTGLRFLP